MTRTKKPRSLLRNIGVISVVAGAASMLAVSSTPARAEGAGNYGAHVAYMKSKDAHDGHYLVGGHMELMLAPFLGVQGAVDYRSEERFVVRTPQGDEGLDVRSLPVLVTGRLYLPAPMTFRPYALAGAGWYRVVYDYSSGLETRLGLKDESVSTFGWHLGAGARMALSPRVSLDGEARYAFIDPERKLGKEVREEIRDLNYDAFHVGVGLSVGF